MRLKRITLNGFMRFKDSFDINFPQNQVTLITGDNGAGKTSILDALCVCLYGKTLRTSGKATSGFLSIYALVNRQSNKATIRVEFENQGHNYVVKREITKNNSSGEVLEDGETKAIGKHVYDYIKTRAIGLDWEGFRKSTVILQGEMSALTDLDPGPRKDAFIQLFGLNVYFKLESLAKKKAETKKADIYAMERANDILKADIQKIPHVENEIKDTEKVVIELNKRKDKLCITVDAKKKEVSTLENEHATYIQKKENLRDMNLQIDEASKAMKKEHKERKRLLLIQRRFNILDGPYKEYLSSDEKLSKLVPLNLEYNRLSNNIDKLNVSLHGDKISIYDTNKQINKTKSLILNIKKQIPSTFTLQKINNYLNNAKNEERSIREKSNGLDAQIKQIDTLIKNLKLKREQVRGKDKCPVCLQKITNSRHIMKHYTSEIGGLMSQKIKLKRDYEQSTLKLVVLSKKVNRLDSLDRELNKKASKIDQLNIEQKRLLDLDNKKKLTEGKIDKTKKSIESTETECKNIAFNPTEYRRLSIIVKRGKKNKLTENYINMETELQRLPKVNIELKSHGDAYSTLINKRKSVKTELMRLAKKEAKFARTKKLLETAQKDFGDNESLFAKESEKERQAKSKLEDLHKKKEELDKNLKQIESFKEEIITLEELSDVFKNIPENILRRLRPFIEKEGTDLINNLSESELTALNIEETTLNVAATINGEIRPIHYFSGGQKTRINMALRVAISRMLSKMPQTKEHTFAIMQTLFVDEGDFGNLDESGIKDAVNVIRSLTREFDRIIMISHVDTIKEIFHGYTIYVQKTGVEESTIKTLGL